MTSLAQKFEEQGQMKEFIDGSGRHYYVIQFEDNSGLVLQKVQSEDEQSIAELVPRDEPTKDSIRRIAADNGFKVEEGNTQQMLRRLLQAEY